MTNHTISAGQGQALFFTGLWVFLWCVCHLWQQRWAAHGDGFGWALGRWDGL